MTSFRHPHRCWLAGLKPKATEADCSRPQEPKISRCRLAQTRRKPQIPKQAAVNEVWDAAMACLGLFEPAQVGLNLAWYLAFICVDITFY